MSWSELERFVAEVEADVALQRALRHCRSRKELILASRRLGYRITRIDLQRAWEDEQESQHRAKG
jgi:predicted ribosomally synthesized peptide with nif11-like leader